MAKRNSTERPRRSTPAMVHVSSTAVVAKAAKSMEVDMASLQAGNLDGGALGSDGEISPRYSAKTLMEWYEKSNALRQNVDAYAVNIDGHGYTYEPEIDLEADNTDDQIRAIIQLEQAESLDSVDAVDPEPDEIAARKKKLADEQRKELLLLQSFFEYCCDESSFVVLRKTLRQDIEACGYGFQEITRNAKGQPARFKYIEAQTVFLLPMDAFPTEWKETRRTASKSLKKATMSTFFRRYIQRIGTSKIYFKQYGDPRVVSALTGKYYSDLEALKTAEPGDVTQGKAAGKPATEIKHFNVHSPLTPYGVPRWIGNLLSVLGARASEEVNYAYFENKSVPPLALLVSGGKLSQDSTDKIRDFITNEIKGKDNYHKILILEAMGESGNAFENGGQPKIELKPLTEAQNSDALFQNYDERSMDKVGMSFRLPRMLRGDTRDFNRSCYSEDTETLTENGWKLWHQIVDGEKIAAFNKDTGFVDFVVPAAKLVYDVVDEPMIEVTTADTNFKVTYDHTVLLGSVGAPFAEFQVGVAQQIPEDRSFDVVVSANGCCGPAGVKTATVQPSQVAESDYTGKVYCFSVPDYGFFVTRRNGKVAFQGNTAEAALDFAERQVFGPERGDSDYFMNRSVLPELGIKHWKLKSHGPTQRDPAVLSKMIHDNQDIFSTNTLLELAQPVFGRNFSRINEPWADKPIKLVLAEMQQQANIQAQDGLGGEVPTDDETGAADDADPDNQTSGTEAQNSRQIVSDNKANQPRQGNGRFGASGSKGKKVKSPKKRQARIHNDS